MDRTDTGVVLVALAGAVLSGIVESNPLTWTVFAILAAAGAFLFWSLGLTIEALPARSGVWDVDNDMWEVEIPLTVHLASKVQIEFTLVLADGSTVTGGQWNIEKGKGRKEYPESTYLAYNPKWFFAGTTAKRVVFLGYGPPPDEPRKLRFDLKGRIWPRQGGELAIPDTAKRL